MANFPFINGLNSKNAGHFVLPKFWFFWGFFLVLMTALDKFPRSNSAMWLLVDRLVTWFMHTQTQELGPQSDGQKWLFLANTIFPIIFSKSVDKISKYFSHGAPQKEETLLFSSFKIKESKVYIFFIWGSGGQIRSFSQLKSTFFL